ncbi:hypothetical protein [Bradyrhizobium zhanjiangense]|uniref:Uncharacterized protein n=1 Tax=Bradyrhizobium zhanjiangense TaxID=1325107 RepID=A0A4Q0QCP1_9BRAD|nr:hypothetical protein [Bradyrhizobium zhanjiangense]RXG87257.1 hypothetical protein EAS61_31700 [Bradyrhizobium zhanjiangense]
MKLQPAQHGLARSAPSEVGGVSVDAGIVAHPPVSAALMPQSAANPLYLLRIIKPAFFRLEMVNAFRRRMQGAVPAGGVGGELVGRLGLRGPSSPSLRRRHDTLRVIGKRPVRLVTIDRISVPIGRPHAGSTSVKGIASEDSQRNIA